MYLQISLEMPSQAVISLILLHHYQYLFQKPVQQCFRTANVVIIIHHQ